MKTIKSKNPLSRKGEKENNKGALIKYSLIIITIIIVIILISPKENTTYKEELKYFEGQLLSPNFAANLIDNIEDDGNIVISPFNITTSLGLLYNGSDNNTKKEIQKFLKSDKETINDLLIDKINDLNEEEKENNKFNKLYLELIEELRNNKYDGLSISDIKALNTQNKEKIILLVTKINLTYDKLTKEVNYSEKYIKKYSLRKDEITYNEYSIKAMINKVLDNYETYQITNKITNNNMLIYNSEKDIINDEFKDKIELYKASVDKFYTEDIVKINNSIKNKTDNNIRYAVDNQELSSNDILSLNTFYFNYKWESTYTKNSVIESTFLLDTDEEIIVETMYSLENSYLENEYATGFIKNFENNKYAFVGILPKKEGNFNLSNLNIDSLIESKTNQNTVATIPKFNYQYESNIKEVLNKSGVKEMFTKQANFSNITEEDFHISHMTQNVYIKIGEKGTEETKINSSELSTFTIDSTYKQVLLNRPFAYMIINNETKDVLIIGKILCP